MKFESCLKNQREIQALLPDSQEEMYAKIIELGRTLPLYPESAKTEHHLVKGCQSRLYLLTEQKEEKLYFQTCSDALISAGLAALLLKIYNGESPEAVVRCPPHVLKEIGLFRILSPGRSNGMKSLYQKMQQEAMSYYVNP